MAKVRVLVGTKKGAFVITSDEARRDWKIEGPHFGGWEVIHVQGSPADPDRLYASQWTDWHGQVVQRSDDGGKSWEAVGNEFTYEGVTGTHQWYDGTPHPWEFKRVWNLKPSPDDPDTVYAGVEDAALFCSNDGGQGWTELAGLRTHSTGQDWMPGAGGMCLHTILIDPANTQRMYVAISAAGAFRSDDAGVSWQVATKGLSSNFLPEPEAPIGHCVHKLAMHPSRPDTVFMQKHWDICRTDDAGESWTEVSGNVPSDFGFPIVVHAHSLKQSSSCRSSATQSTIRRRASCGYSEAARGATSGKRSPRASRSGTATWTSCVTQWRWTRSTPAAFISARPAGRCTHRRTPATRGRR